MIHIPDELAEQHARMVEIALRLGERERAVRAIDRAFEEAEKLDQDLVTVDSHVGRVCSVRISHRLESIGINSISELLTHTREEILTASQIGKVSVDLIEFELAKHGWHLEK